MMMGNDQYAQTYAMMKSGKQKSKGVIFIEDISDKAFWEKIATQHIVQLYSENGKAITGKSKLLEICSVNQLIAIDSDFDFICPNHRAESALCSKKKDFILQTYAHGRENLIFSPECLHEILANKFQLYVDNHVNNILEIFQKLSAIWFEPYRKFLFLMNQKDTQAIEHKDWIERIKFQNKESQDIALKTDFSAYQQRIQQLDDDLYQKVSNQEEYQPFCEQLKQKDYTPETVCYFIRCHDFEEQFVLPIMQMICSERIKTEMGLIASNYPANEVKNRKEQLKNHFQKTNNIETVLNHYFYDVYFRDKQYNHIFLKRIMADYQRVIQ